MNGKRLLDTNAVVALFRRDDAIQQLLAGAAEVFVPVTVVGELYYGAEHSGRPGDNEKQVTQFANANSVLTCDLITARIYGQIKQSLKQKGKPIPENDIWIAAVALQFGLILVTRDQHFSHVDNLLTEAW